MERKRKLYIAKVAVVMSAIPLLLWAHSAGPPSGKAGVPGETTCNQAQCHVGTALNGGGGSVKVTFPGGSTYAPGVKQHLVVTISDPSRRQSLGFSTDRTALLGFQDSGRVLHLHGPVHRRGL